MRAALAALLALALGCSTGSNTRFEQRRIIGVTTVQLGEYAVPALTIGEGPSVSVFQSRSCGSRVKIRGFATTTNTTSALGIYSSTEEKTFRFKGEMEVFPTNSVESVSE